MRWGEGALGLDRLARACQLCSQANTARLGSFDWSDYRLDEAAVLVPLINKNESAQILFTKRTESMKRHSGQVCFPGGMIDGLIGEKPEQAALRELREEIKLSPPTAKIRVIGSLGCYPNRPSKLRVRPFLGLLDDGVDFNVGSPQEVESVFAMNLWDLQSPKMQEVSPGWPMMPFYPVADQLYTIWGMTAYILKDYLDTLYSLK
jgi:8-oxo-dGTP pyrophosphatase MutT (NUDIX family)